jgi:mutator protein MutT
MDYITNLRKKVGHDPLILPGCTLLALNKNNELLMMKRTDNHCWGVPGGMMEPGETPEETVIRETEEEIGVQPENLKLFGIYSGPALYYVYPNGDQVFGVAIVYQCIDFFAEIQLNEEHSIYAYFALTDLPENISPPILPIIRDLVKQYSQQ